MINYLKGALVGAALLTATVAAYIGAMLIGVHLVMALGIVGFLISLILLGAFLGVMVTAAGKIETAFSNAMKKIGL